jgi:hypothetical protein
MQSKHLIHAKQSYFEHFSDSISYSFKALKAVWFFTVHSIVPDFYQCNGSETIKELNDLLQEKISKIKNQEN